LSASKRPELFREEWRRIQGTGRSGSQVNGQIVLNLSAGGGGYAVIDGMTITPH